MYPMLLSAYRTLSDKCVLLLLAFLQHLPVGLLAYGSHKGGHMTICWEVVPREASHLPQQGNEGVMMG